MAENDAPKDPNTDSTNLTTVTPPADPVTPTPDPVEPDPKAVEDPIVIPDPVAPVAPEPTPTTSSGEDEIEDADKKVISKIAGDAVAEKTKEYDKIIADTERSLRDIRLKDALLTNPELQKYEPHIKKWFDSGVYDVAIKSGAMTIKEAATLVAMKDPNFQKNLLKAGAEAERVAADIASRSASGGNNIRPQEPGENIIAGIGDPSTMTPKEISDLAVRAKAGEFVKTQ